MNNTNKMLFGLIVTVIFSYPSHAVYVNLASAEVLTQRLKALNSTYITAIVEDTNLIELIANKCYDTSKLVKCVRRTIDGYVNPRELNELIIIITEVLMQGNLEALTEFSRYYKLSSGPCRIS